MRNRSGHHLMTLTIIVTILLLLATNIRASEIEGRVKRELYFNTLDGAVYSWNVQSQRINLIVDYDYQLDRSSGWSSVTFSDNNRQLAYIRTESNTRWIGVSELNEWQPIELEIDVHFDYKKVYLNWLPNNKQIVISYLIDIPQGLRQPAIYNALVGRQILDTSNLSGGLINFPYNCTELVVISFNAALQCNINNDLYSNNGTFPTTIWYDFLRGEILQHLESASVLSFPIQDFVYPNWVWSEQSGLAFFDNGSHNLPNGVNLVLIDSAQPLHSETHATLFGTISWSPNGTRLLIQDNDLRIWHVYNIAEKQVIASIEIPNLNFQSGVIWFQDSDHIAYVTEIGHQSTLHVKTLSNNLDTILTIENSVTDLAAP